MKFLTAEAARLNVTVESADLPSHQAARYLHTERRIVVNADLPILDTWKAVALALGYANNADGLDDDEALARAKEHAARLLIERSKTLDVETLALGVALTTDFPHTTLPE